MCILCTIRITHHKTYIHTQYPMGNIQHTVLCILVFELLTEHIHIHTYYLLTTLTHAQLQMHVTHCEI